jgi:hypothetical protein
MLKPQTLRPLLIINLCFFLLHWGGLSSIKPYLVHVLQNFGLGEAASWTTVTITEVQSDPQEGFLQNFGLSEAASWTTVTITEVQSDPREGFLQNFGLGEAASWTTVQGVPGEGFGCVLSFG